MKKILVVISLALLAVGCDSHRYEKQAIRFHDDGRAKVIVTVTPVYDHQNIHLPWNLAEDLTEIIKTRLTHKSNIFISNTLDLEPKIREESSAPLPLEHHDENKSLNVHYENLKVKFPGSEFVVFMELAEHKIHPKQEHDTIIDKITPSHALDLAMRIRIYDLRGETPKVILQEIIQQRHLLPKQFAKLDYNSTIWGKKTYSISPMGFAHMHFAKEVSNRIESYLLLAKTK